MEVWTVLSRLKKSLHFVLANDYEFAWKDRPFKLTTELYYKKMSSLMPYYMDNMRIRYSGKNNAKGYAYGVDARLFGEFVPGVDSWISVGYSRIYENIDNKGFIPRPTDQRFRVSMFYQDYMPKFPSMRVNLNFWSMRADFLWERRYYLMQMGRLILIRTYHSKNIDLV